MENSGAQLIETPHHQIPSESIEVTQVTEDNQVQQGQDEGQTVQVEMDPNVSVQEGQVQLLDEHGQPVEVLGQPVHVFGEGEMVTESQIVSETDTDVSHVISAERSNVIEPGSVPHSGHPITVKVISSNQTVPNLPRKMISLFKTQSDVPGSSGKLKQIDHDSESIDSKEQTVIS